MKRMQPFVAAMAISVLGSYLALAQQPTQAPPQQMSFFITSAGSGRGANLGGLAGADRICQTLATSLGGSLSVESEVGKGTKFALRLPAPGASEESIA